jgi:hypothetical protein
MATHYATFGGPIEHPVIRLGKVLMVLHGMINGGYMIVSYCPRSKATALRRVR